MDGGEGRFKVERKGAFGKEGKEEGTKGVQPKERDLRKSPKGGDSVLGEKYHRLNLFLGLTI